MIDVIVMASGDSAPVWILAAGPAGAAATYAQPVQGDQEKVDHISRTRDSDIDGDNSAKHRERVQRIR